jgi:glycosyltransferase involved in cell wall biosynthesis
MALYRQRHPQVPDERFALIENGYDEESFVAAEVDHARAPLNDGCFTLLHSGIVYPSERDPRGLIDALAGLRRRAPELAQRLRVRFRAAVHEPLIRELARGAQVDEMIELLPPVPYTEALWEMMRADGLLAMQGSNCNMQVPAKVYEYMRAGRPILGLTDPAGDTAAVLRQAGVRDIAMLEDSQAVESALGDFLRACAAGRTTPPDVQATANASRRARARELARLLDGVSMRHPPSLHGRVPA